MYSYSTRIWANDHKICESEKKQKKNKNCEENVNLKRVSLSIYSFIVWMDNGYTHCTHTSHAMVDIHTHCMNILFTKDFFCDYSCACMYLRFEESFGHEDGKKKKQKKNKREDNGKDTTRR